MKHDALVEPGIEIVERVPIPDDLVPADAQVEIEAKKAAGYYTPDDADREDLKTIGRPRARQVSDHARVAHRSSGDRARRLSLLIAEAVRERAHRDARDRPRRQAAEFPHRSRPMLDAGRRLRADVIRGKLSRLSTCRSIRAGGISSSAARPLGCDRRARSTGPMRAARARAEFDLAIVSVLLDAGAGPAWRYRDAVTGSAVGRSEGLGAREPRACSTAALFSADPRDPLRADAARLANLTPAISRAAFRFGATIRWSASKAAPTLLRAAGRAGCREAGRLRAARHAAPGRPVRSPCGAGRRRQGCRRRRS